MRETLFYRLGTWIYRHQLLIIMLWIVVTLSCIPVIPNILTPFQSTGFVAEHSDSAKTDLYLKKHLDYYNNRFIAIYHSEPMLATDPAYLAKLKKSLQGLKHMPEKHGVILPDVNNGQISKDKHTAYVIILFKDNAPMPDATLDQLRAAVKTPVNMSMYLGGEALFLENVNEQTQTDLHNADLIAAPASIITLIIVFGTLVAALLPIVLGGGCAMIILVILYLFSQLFSLSIFTLNIALLLGLCLTLDYALFMIYRFREELQDPTHTIMTALATTVATAGRSVFFSGLAVFVSLSALLFFSINILFSIGIGGLVAVFIAVSSALTLLPAILAVLNHRINRLPIGLHPRRTKAPKSITGSFWHKIAFSVVKRPVLVFFVVLVALLFLGYPFMHVRLGVSDFRILPKDSRSYQFFHQYQKKFNENELTPILLLVKSKNTPILSTENLQKLYDFSKRLKRHRLIKDVDSIVSTKPLLTVEQYGALYHAPKQTRPASIQQLLTITTGESFTVISVLSKYDSNASQTKTLITQLRKMKPGKGLSLHLTGTPVNNMDVLQSIAHFFLYAVLWVMVLTYLILLVLLRSLFLPLKAILMNVLSLCASYGVLVFVFQEGHLQHLLDFNTQTMLDISLLVIIFCALFGFSMDYEVFLLTRIKECYDKTHDNNKSIIFGIEKSCRIITSAAIIVIVLCGSFMCADVLMVKEFGLGIAVAIFVDAFIIRAFLVPATMVLVKSWNWYLPKWLDKLLP